MPADWTPPAEVVARGAKAHCYALGDGLGRACGWGACAAAGRCAIKSDDLPPEALEAATALLRASDLGEAVTIMQDMLDGVAGARDAARAFLARMRGP